VLTGLGWSALGAIPSVAIRSAFAAHVFERAGRRRVVVHWRSFPLGTAKRDEVALIERAVTTQVQGIQLSVPDATDQLLLACAYFRSLAEVERVSWALETCAILRGTGDTLDERAFAERARAAGVLRECVAALDAIATATSARGLSVPVFSVAEAAVPGARREVRAPVRATGIRRALFAIGAGLRRYSAVCRSDGVTRTPWGYARFTVAFYRYEWGASGLRGLAMAGARRFLDGDDQPVVSRTL